MTRKRRSFAKPVPEWGAPFKCGESSRWLRWCESPEAHGFRRVGRTGGAYKDATGIRPCDMAGWYLNEYQDETAWGVVYRLSHGRGFIAGVATSMDPDGVAALAVCEAPESDLATAARYADQLAEWYAEAERDYQEAFSAGAWAGETWRERMAEALEFISAARTMRTAARIALRRALAQRDGVAAGIVPPDVCTEAARLYRQALVSSRDKVKAACEAREEAWGALHDAEPPAWSESALRAFREGVGFA